MTDVDCRYALPLGTVINEFRIVDVLGVGSFGIVYSAEHIDLKGKIALKEFFPIELACRHEGTEVVPLSSETEEAYYWALDKFLEEATILWRLANSKEHPNIVCVRHYTKANGTAYLVMDYEKGLPLSEKLQEHVTLPAEELKKYLDPLLDGLERVHEKKIWHRDIKPSNILIRCDGSPILIDFGSARHDLPGRPQSRFYSYTAVYAAPEQVNEGGSQGPWTDIYAFGATLYRVVTGTDPVNAAKRAQGEPFPPAVQAAKKDEYTQSFLSAIDAALELNPKNRPQSVAEWRCLLEKQELSNEQNAEKPTEIRPSSSKLSKPNGSSADIDPSIDVSVEFGGESNSKKREKKPFHAPNMTNVGIGFISQVLKSRWALIALIALIAVIALLLLKNRFGENEEEFLRLSMATASARDEAVSARNQARNQSADNLPSFLQAQSLFEKAKAAESKGQYSEAESEYKDALRLFIIAANEKMSKVDSSEKEKESESAIISVPDKKICVEPFDPNSPVGFLCSYFRDCQRRDADSAIEKRADLEPEYFDLLRSEIQNSEYYKIADITLLESSGNYADIYTKYTYKRKGQNPISFVGSFILGKNKSGHWEIVSKPGT